MCDEGMPKYYSDGDESGLNCRQCVPQNSQYIPLSHSNGFGWYNGMPVFAVQSQMQVLPNGQSVMPVLPNGQSVMPVLPNGQSVMPVLPNGQSVMPIQYITQMHNLRNMC